MLEFVTLTGADHTVQKYRMYELCSNPSVPLEMAFLVSIPRMGSPRYPSFSVLTSLLEIARDCNQRTAIHLCGGMARIMVGLGSLSQIPGELSSLLEKVDRIQINLPQNLITEEGISEALRRLNKPLVFQWRNQEFPPTQPRLQWLYDLSGGKGIVPSEWPTLPGDQVVGLAGGLGPGRIAPLIRRMSSGRYWIDMESSLRDSKDQFSPDICHRVLDEALEALSQEFQAHWVPSP